MSGVRPQDRLAWHRQLSCDRELSHVAIHVGLAISNHFNNGNGECFVGMERLAGEARVHRVTAVKAVEMLARRGHLRVKTGGGRGWANTYAMVIREPYQPARNCSASTTVSTPETVAAGTVNCSASTTPTLKENSKKERASFSMKEDSTPVYSENPSSSPANNTPDPGYRIGANGHAVLKVGSHQCEAWLRYHQATGNTRRASLMRHLAESSRWGEWEEPTPWPPTHVSPRDESPRTESGRPMKVKHRA